MGGEGRGGVEMALVQVSVTHSWARGGAGRERIGGAGRRQMDIGNGRDAHAKAR